MRFKTVLKRISIFLLCFILLSFSVFFSYSRTVKAAVPVVAVGIAAIASFLGAAGVSLTTQDMTKQSFTDSLYDMANQYSESSNVISLEDAMKTKDALNYYYNSKAGDAVVSFGDEFSSWLNGFKNWFVNNFALTDSGETVVLAEDKFTTYSGESYAYYTSFSEFVSGKVPAPSVTVSTSPEVIHISQDRYLVVVGYDDGFQYGYYRPGVRFQLYNSQGVLLGSNGHRYASSTPNDFSFIRVCFQWFPQYGYFGINSLPLDSGSYSTGGYSWHLPDLTLNNVTTSSIGLSGSLTDGYNDFEQALNDAKTDAGVNGQVVVDVGSVEVDKPYTDEAIANGILDNAITNVGTGTLVGGYADEKEVEQETDAEKVPTVAEIGEGIVLVDGLEDFFPFCIPFDLYEIINLLNVPAEAPKFDWKMSFSGRVDDYDISIDLTPYNTVATVFRTMIVIVFLIFLTLKTRDLIRG